MTKTPEAHHMLRGSQSLKTNQPKTNIPPNNGKVLRNTSDHTTTTPTEGQPTAVHNDYQQTLTNYHNALNQLTQPQTITNINGQTHTTPPLIQQLHTDLTTTKTDTPPSQAFKSSLPMWTEAHDLREAIHTTLKHLCKATNTPTPQTLPNLLTWAHNPPTSPHHNDALKTATHALQQCAQQAEWLLYPPLFEITTPCPQCGETTHTTNGTTTNVLTIHNHYAQCAHCRSRWEGADIALLAQQINNHQQDQEQVITI